MTNPLRKNLMGKIFGKLLALYPGPTIQSGNAPRSTWICICECGKEKLVTTNHLMAGSIKSCGCIPRAIPLPNNHRAKQRLFSVCKRSAKIRGLAFRLSRKKFIQLVENNCFYCNKKPMQGSKTDRGYLSNGIDRIDNSKGYYSKNCVTCCKTCNTMKNTLSLEEFLYHISNIYNNFKKDSNRGNFT